MILQSDMLSKLERKNRREIEKDINVGKERGVSVIVDWKAVVQIAQEKRKKERSKKLAINSRRHVPPQRMIEVEVSEK